jgi:D-galactarolactone cycloisomerase
MPRIVDIDLICMEFAIDPEMAYGTSRGLNFKRSSALFKVTTDDGITGYGEGLGPVQPIRAYLGLLKSFFVGQSLYDFELNAAYCRDRLYHFGFGHNTATLSGINVAVYDAIGKTLGVSAHDLIGGKRAEKIPCYATTGYITRGTKNTLEMQLAKVDKKVFDGVKIKIGKGPQSDLERVRIARQILGDDMRLMVDVNGNYTVDIMLQSLRLIEPYNVQWVEEPLPHGDLKGHAELRARSPIPIATGEGLSSLEEFSNLIEARGVDIAQPAIGRCGGLAEARKIATLAHLHNLRVAPAVWGGAFGLAAGIHFLASTPITPHTENVPFPTLLEYDIAINPLRDDIVKENLWPVEGGVVVPTGPGLGLTLDMEKVEKYRIREF